MHSIRFEVRKELLLRNHMLLTIGSRTEKPQLYWPFQIVTFKYLPGMMLTLWPTTMDILHFEQVFWVDVCGCIFTPVEIMSHVRNGVFFLETEIVRKLPRPS